ncbi:MAG: PAC2 family protein [Candidatus Omnitrophica bacterium]|nr:PAC2 family protein [Candidatus Omnitrophota bacterium]MBU4303787.1 PAC2 family protein [Candidatus Omnitrophota bacterium]MBU4468595.1 PAC2 family protein [Candidatus Omnitrophota bacterium]MCG2708666.1 PAC2 family protein [Candidatus Omnitrophota bacterium]
MDALVMIKKPRLKKPYLIVAWPGMGEVAFKAAEYLIEELKAQEFARIIPDEFFYLSGSVISAGILEVPLLPQGKFYYWKNPAAKGAGSGKNDLVIFLSNAQPDLAKADSYAQAIINLAKDLGVESVVSFASMPQATDHTQDSGVWFAATDQKIKESLKKYNFAALIDGQISGMNGLFLGMAKKAQLKGFCLLGEIPLYTIQIENPKASAAVLVALGKILNIQINVAPLKEQAQIMENEINKMLEYLKLGNAGVSAPIGEEEVELIKKTLSQLTNLPVSVKEKIEKLFEESRQDIAKAKELKVQLDKWNVYKEYEDKFLDLFRKNTGKGN